ncbi:hypothetical protein GCM10023093_02090 [Nemorincola caseinilytica]|uniref:Uncharacterized protein n=2 Tax=Nemorincola caseinilytica TaxID=2054315 RepID=A0ABP8N578_9BACT
MCLQKAYAYDSTGRAIKVMTLPRVRGYKVNMTEDQFIASVRAAGLRCTRAHISYGNYYYDTSSLALAHTKDEHIAIQYYWRIQGITNGKDTIPLLDISFSDANGIRRVEPFLPRRYGYAFYGFVEPATATQQAMSRKEYRRQNKEYRLLRRRYDRLVRTHFVNVFCTSPKK